MNSKEIKLPERIFCSGKKSFHSSLENLNVSCFGCEKGIYTRPVHVCLDCCYKLKDLNNTITKLTNRALCIDFDSDFNKSVENSLHLRKKSVQKGENYLSKGLECTI